MKAELEAIAKQALEELKGAQDLKVLDAVRVKYLGKKGELTAILKQMGKLSAEERPVIGQLANQVRADIEQMLEQTKTDLEAKALDIRLAGETLDVTLPGQKKPLGKKHPLTIVLDELKEIVVGMGFEIATGPEVELDYYNFEALNIPKDHPSRDTQDTFYISDNVLLRTQTSPMQIRTMEKKKPPIRIIAPGRVYRSDAVDATHSPLFHQVAPSSASARTISHSPSLPPSWTFSASTATARAAACARARAGLRFWAAAWCTRRCCLTAASTRRSTAALRSAWGWSAWS